MLGFIGEEKGFLLNMTGNGRPECIKERRREVVQPNLRYIAVWRGEKRRRRSKKTAAQ